MQFLQEDAVRELLEWDALISSMETALASFTHPRDRGTGAQKLPQPARPPSRRW